MSDKTVCCKCKAPKENINLSYCNSCNAEKTRNWYKNNLEKAKIISKRTYNKHKESHIARATKWNKDNKLSHRNSNATWRWKLRQEIIEEYGGSCACCGEVIPEFLSIDHINNDGNVERKQNNSKGGAKFYKELKDRGFPKDNYQLLCMNCNFAKGHFGICPHQVMNLSVAPIMGIDVV